MKFKIDSLSSVASGFVFSVLTTVVGLWMAYKTNNLSALIYPVLMGAGVGAISFLLHESIHSGNRRAQSSLRLKFFQGVMALGFSFLVMTPYFIESSVSSASLTGQSFMAQWGGVALLALGVSAVTFFSLNLKEKFFQTPTRRAGYSQNHTGFVYRPGVAIAVSMSQSNYKSPSLDKEEPSVQTTLSMNNFKHPLASKSQDSVAEAMEVRSEASSSFSIV